MLYQGCFFRVLAREAILIRISKKDVLFENLYGNRNKQTYRQRAVGLLFFLILLKSGFLLFLQDLVLNMFILLIFILVVFI